MKTTTIQAVVTYVGDLTERFAEWGTRCLFRLNQGGDTEQIIEVDHRAQDLSPEEFAREAEGFIRTVAEEEESIRWVIAEREGAT